MGDIAFRLGLIAVLLTGCGKVADNQGPADAGIDADLSGTATVVTQASLFGGTVGAKVGNIDIVSHLPNNMVLATATTDTSGSATIKVYPGGSVTAVYKHTVDRGADLITWAGVKPGDTLIFGSRQFSATGQTAQSLGVQTYTWPALANATQFQVVTSCGSVSVFSATATSLMASESNICHREPMDVVFRGFNGNTLVGYGFRSNVAFTSGGTVALTAWTTTIPTGTVNISGLPPEVAMLSGEFITVIDSNPNVLTGATLYNGTPTGGAFSTTFPSMATGERTVGELFLQRQGFDGMTVFDSFSSSTLTQTVTSPTLPIWGQGFTTMSSELHKAVWFLIPEANTTPNTDGQVLHMSWNHLISGTSHPSQWDVIMPPGQTSLDIPPMPPALADHQPVENDFLSGSMTVFDIASVSSYDMLRTLPSANIMCLRCTVFAGDFQHVALSQF
jgi:hypothetical protein